jgi:ABC-type transporter Mla subunit MlaD
VRRRGVGALAASPTMVGSLTVLIVILAVFLAYNANQGLPFVPTYRLTAEVPNANQLVPGNEVRMGGVRVGLVESIDPVSEADGEVFASLNLKLDDTVRPLPADSKIIVRSRSALGLKYLEIRRGSSGQGLEEGSVLQLAAARPEPVEIDEVFNMFDDPTRKAIRVNQVEFGGALAGRGVDLNEALAELRPTVEQLIPVMRNLASPRTQLERLFVALARSAAEVAPVAEVQAAMFGNLDTTFAAIANVSRPFVQETISETPPTLETTIETGPNIRNFMRDSSALFADLRPGAEAIEENAPALASALEIGAPILEDTPVLNRELDPTAQALLDFQRDRRVRSGIDELNALMRPLGGLLRFVAPAQSVCNYGTLLFRNASSLLSEAHANGASGQRFILFDTPKGPNNEGSPAAAPANGPDRANFLHANPYPNTAAPGQSPRECEAGNEPFIVGEQVIGNVPGDQGIETEGQLRSQLNGGGG